MMGCGIGGIEVTERQVTLLLSDGRDRSVLFHTHDDS